MSSIPLSLWDKQIIMIENNDWNHTITKILWSQKINIWLHFFASIKAIIK